MTNTEKDLETHSFILLGKTGVEKVLYAII